MSEMPETFYARNDAHIAYQVFGEGPDLLLSMGIPVWMDSWWDAPTPGRMTAAVVIDSAARLAPAHDYLAADRAIEPRESQSAEWLERDSNEILVSRTVTDLVAGSGLEFDERGEHELKGVPGRWQLYAVRG